MNEARKDKLPIFAARFSELRGDRTQAEFAQFLGISRATVGFYENGERIPDALVLRQIAERCGVTTDYLVGLSDNKTTENYDVGIKFGLNDDAISHLGFFKKAHDRKKSYSLSVQYLTELDVLNKLLENGDLQRICFLISDLTLKKSNYIKDKQKVETTTDAIVAEKKRFNKNYKPEEDSELCDLKLDEHAEDDYFKYSRWCVSREIEQLSDEILEQTFDIQLEKSDPNADDPEAR